MKPDTAAAVRAGIVDAAARLILSDGVGAATIYATAQRAGVSNATVYRLWSSRADLLIDAFDRLFPGPPARGKAEGPDDELVDTVLALASILGGEVGVRFMELQMFLPSDGPRWQFVDTVMTPWRLRFIAIWRVGVERAVFDPLVDEGIAVDQLVGAVLAQAFLTPTMDSRAGASTLRRRVDAAMNGLRSSRPA